VGDLDAAGARQSSRRIAVRRFRGGELGLADDPDLVATEEPFEIRVGYSRRDGSRAEEPVSVTMRTPGHDENLAVGFLFTEGIIRAGSDVQSVTARGQGADGSINVVRVELVPGVTVDFKRLERNFYMTSSCGVCGKASNDAVAVQRQYEIGAVDFQKTGEALGR
jgi:FdhD protein